MKSNRNDDDLMVTCNVSPQLTPWSNYKPFAKPTKHLRLKGKAKRLQQWFNIEDSDDATDSPTGKTGEWRNIKAVK